MVNLFVFLSYRAALIKFTTTFYTVPHSRALTQLGLGALPEHSLAYDITDLGTEPLTPRLLYLLHLSTPTIGLAKVIFR